MYRLLLWSMLSWPLAHCAVADETGMGEPTRLQGDQLRPAARQIGQTSRGILPDYTPSAFQPQPTESKPSPATSSPQSAEASLAWHQSPAPAADSAKTSSPSGPPFQRADGSPAAAQQPRGDLLPANAPLPISRNSAAPPDAGSHKSVMKTGEDGTTWGGIDSLLTVAGSLGIVLGLFLLTMWCLRRGMPKATRSLPPEVVEVLGRAPLAGKQQMHLIRFGNKLVLAAVSPAGVDTISEITDPVEANRLAGYCEQNRPSSATASFRGILDRLDDRIGHDSAQEQPRRANRGLASLIGLKGSGAEDEYA